MPLLLLSRPTQTPKHTMCVNLRTALTKLEPKTLILDGESTTKSMTTSTAASSKVPQGRLSSHQQLAPKKTNPKPFNLSRSNSRRSKDVLFKERNDKEQRETEEFIITQKSFKANKVPISQYVPKLAVKRSTKELTDFQEFNLSSTTAGSTTKFNKYVSNASKYQTNQTSYNSVMTYHTKISASNPK